MNRTLRVGIFCDFEEENWPSMDLVSTMLVENLNRSHAREVITTRVCPPMRRRFSRNGNGKGSLFNADRLLNRFSDYPRFVRGQRDEFDVFHIIDHSYGQLLHELPSERTVITCHDLDTFRCLLEPDQDPRPMYFRKMMERTLSGFRKAARVACVSATTRDELLSFNLIAPERVVVVPNGVAPSFSPLPDAEADGEANRLLGEAEDHQFDLLHVGSTIPRKRIHDLLHIVARVKKAFPAVRLLRVGGAFTAEQTKLADELNLQASLVVLPRITTDALAAVYRRAALLLQPSEREGFGLPVIEALACGTPVIASDLAVLREVGGDAAVYCSVGDVENWSESVLKFLRDTRAHPDGFERRERGLAQAAKFSWSENASKLVTIYQQLAQGLQ